MSEKIDYSKGIYDARQLGTGRMLILGVQHMFAMFGATVLVPLLTGLSVSTTLLCPPCHQGQGPGLPWLLVCLPGRFFHCSPHAG